MARGGEGLVPGDLRAGDAGAIHALHRQREAAGVGDAHGLRHAEVRGAGQSGGDHDLRLMQFQDAHGFHGFTLSASGIQEIATSPETKVWQPRR